MWKLWYVIGDSILLHGYQGDDSFDPTSIFCFGFFSMRRHITWWPLCLIGGTKALLVFMSLLVKTKTMEIVHKYDQHVCCPCLSKWNNFLNLAIATSFPFVETLAVDVIDFLFDGPSCLNEFWERLLATELLMFHWHAVTNDKCAIALL